LGFSCLLARPQRDKSLHYEVQMCYYLFYYREIFFQGGTMKIVTLELDDDMFAKISDSPKINISMESVF
jgi:hypothetical protein